MIILAISSRGWPSILVGSLSGSHKREIAKKHEQSQGFKLGDHKHNPCYGGKCNDKHLKTAHSLNVQLGGITNLI